MNSIPESITEISSTTNLYNPSIWSMISSADHISKVVMSILLIGSICSWAIIFSKLVTLKQIKAKILQFESVFWSGQVLDQLFESIKRNVNNPLSAVFVNAMTECTRNKIKSSNIALNTGLKERIVQSMSLTRDREIAKLEKNLDILAIIGSNALFVGLFGTVWGIMHSFQSIAGSKNTSLAVVAPGIAEALLATAIGLIVAVPCVVFYSYLSSKINEIYSKIEDFSGELNNILSRAIDEESI